MKREPRRWLPWLPLAAAFVAALILYPLGLRATWEPPLLLPLANLTVFIAASFVASVLAALGFVQSRSLTLLFLGAGILAFGAGTTLGSFLVSYASSNAGVTAHNIASLLAAALILASAVLLGRRSSVGGSMLPALLLSYSFPTAVIVVVGEMAARGRLPLFVTPAGDTTTLRTVVIAAGTVAFLMSSVLYLMTARRQKERFLEVCGIGLALCALGLAAVGAAVVGSALSWVGRVAQDVGQFYLLASLAMTLNRRGGLELGAAEAVGSSFKSLEGALKRSEDERRRATESEARLLALMDHSPSYVFLKDEAGRFVYVNRTFQDRFLHGSHWGGKSDFDFLPREVAEVFKANDERVLQTGQPQQYLEDSMDDEGKRFCSLTYKFPFTDAEQKRYVGGIGIDATDFVRAQEALRENEALLNAVFGSLPVGIAVLDLDEQVVLENAEMRRFMPTGVPPSRDESRYERWEAYHPDGRRVGRDEFPGALAIRGEATLPGMEFLFTQDDGRQIWTRFAAMPVRDEGDGVTGVVLVISDIDEVKRAYESLRESERRLQLLSEANSLLLTTNDPEAAIQSIAERVKEHLGADVFFNYILDEGAERLRLNAWGGVDRRVAKMIERLDLGQAICGCVARDGTPIHSKDVQHNGDERAELVRKMGVQAYACHPIHSGDRTVGTLSFGTKRKTAFDDDEIALMRTVTEQVSVAVEKARLYQAQRTRRRRIELLHGLMEVAVSSVDLREVGQQILEYLSTKSDFRMASIWMKRVDELDLVSSVGYPKSYEELSPMPLSAEYDAPKAFRSGKTLVVPQTSNPNVAEAYERMGLSIGTYIVLPLVARGRKIGVLSFVWDERKDLNHFDVQFYESVAGEIAVVLENAVMYRTEHDISETLQETLVVLPTRVSGVRFSREYASATYQTGHVGGDFVDVFEVTSDVVGISLGDVSGKGIDAAVTTSLVRTTLRVHAVDGQGVAETVNKTNSVVRRFIPQDSFVTLWFGLLNVNTGRLRYVGAGHPPALVLATDGTVRSLEHGDPFVGAFFDISFAEHVAVLGPGERLVIYSDGVIEARSPEGAFLTEDGLRALVARHANEATEELSARLMGEVISFSEGVLRDDAAILVVERAPL